MKHRNKLCVEKSKVLIDLQLHQGCVPVRQAEVRGVRTLKHDLIYDSVHFTTKLELIFLKIHKNILEN